MYKSLLFLLFVYDFDLFTIVLANKTHGWWALTTLDGPVKMIQEININDVIYVDNTLKEVFLFTSVLALSAPEGDTCGLSSGASCVLRQVSVAYKN